MRWRGVAAVGHELQPFAIGDEAVGQAMVLQQHLVARTLVVVEEGLPRVPHAMNAAGQVEPPGRAPVPSPRRRTGQSGEDGAGR